MITSSDPTLLAEIAHDEGKRRRPYRDTRGFWTIGIGHNLDAEGLCDAAIEAQLAYDLQVKCFDALDTRLPWWREHPASVQRTLVNLCFNLGIAGLLKWPRTLALIQGGYYDRAAEAIRSNKVYVNQVGPRAERLARSLEDAAT